MPIPAMRELARRLLAYEAVAGENSVATGSAAHRVYEKLRLRLSAVAGVAGFHSLATRGLALAKPEAPGLSEVRIEADGRLQGFERVEPHAETTGEDEAGVVLIAHLLGLLFTFIGGALTVRLVQDAWPDAAVEESRTANGGDE
jgi:hypothetical protein